MPRPTANDAAEYYFTYINQVPAGDIGEILAAQLEPTLTELRAISEEKSLHRYAEGKWSIREVLNHLNDAERIFAHRAHWFSRAFDAPLPSFDQDIAVTNAAADSIPWAAHIEEFRTIRQATLTQFANMPEAAWTRIGTASGNPVTVNALAYILAGHVEHHLQVLRERY